MRIKAPFKVAVSATLGGEYRSFISSYNGRWHFEMHLPAPSDLILAALDLEDAGDLIWACFTCGTEFYGREKRCLVCGEPRCEKCVHFHERHQ